MRVIRTWPRINWTLIWNNIWQAPIPLRFKSTWYEIVHDIKTTKQRLHAINLAPTDNCVHCSQTDTLQHRLTQCGDATTQWLWTRGKIAQILRTNPSNVSPDWLQRPCI